MAADKDPQDYDALLAEVERSMAADAGRPAADVPARTQGAGVARRPPAEPEPTSDGPLGRPVLALIAGVAAGALVFLLFALLPFVGSTSGAIGAFIGAALTALLLPRRR